ICVMQDPRGRFSGVQQIFLDGPALAPVHPVKMTLGDPGVIRLAGLQDGTLTVANDVETALLLLSASPTRPVWAAIGGTGLRRLTPPPRIRRVELGLRQDQVDRRAAAALTQRLLQEGRDVRWFEPPTPGPAPDPGLEEAAG
ncbi:MAG: toprim domain-containing protein, partial [Kiloniellales bacterium]